jgi:hypothetical protein|uniref:Uncharacterized protein n=1 Tax=Haptolina ericina TaxID=156174 RepID=A0A7S3FL77_9EUKA|mmetsp:Transcript_72198/g.160527  ORF Transcript_72198/g.160527 Transcript_72198/m.160527 type:complete len:107 (+) Transcript_72198:361-681(+)
MRQPAGGAKGNSSSQLSAEQLQAANDPVKEPLYLVGMDAHSALDLGWRGQGEWVEERQDGKVYDAGGGWPGCDGSGDKSGVDGRAGTMGKAATHNQHPIENPTAPY